MIDKNKLNSDLLDSFIAYQWRLENPMPLPNESEELIFNHYRNDRLFHNKVRSMAAGVMSILDKHLSEAGDSK